MTRSQVAGVPSGTRISGIDGMRALAASAVFLCHLVAYWELQGRLPGKLTQLPALGAHGVDLFVVISGFCLALPVARKYGFPLNVRTFLVRRATRILPPYFLALALCATVALLPSTWERVVSERASVGDVALHALLVQTLVPGQIATINGSFWSIALEVHLYLAFPLLVVLWRRIGAEGVVITSAVLSLLWWCAGLADTWVLGDDHVIVDRLVQFAIGMWAAQRVAQSRVPDRRLLWAGVIVGGLAAAVVSTEQISFGKSMVWSVPSVCALLLAAHRFESQFLGLPLERLGLISYSFYLLQQPLLLLTSDIANSLTASPVILLILGCTACFALTTLLSWVMYMAVEAPSIRWGARLTNRAPARPEHPLVELS